MAKEIQISREAILDGVMGIIEESGYASVSARSVADRLGISTQPIYREFGDMDGVRKAALDRGLEIFSRYVSGDALTQAVRYVMFAAEHGKLFDFLFRGKQYSYAGLDELSHSLISVDIIDKLADITGLERERTFRLHLLVWMAIHGLATYCCDNTVGLSDGDVEKFTKELTMALTAFYKREGKA